MAPLHLPVAVVVELAHQTSLLVLLLLCWYLVMFLPLLVRESQAKNVGVLRFVFSHTHTHTHREKTDPWLAGGGVVSVAVPWRGCVFL